MWGALLPFFFFGAAMFAKPTRAGYSVPTTTTPKITTTPKTVGEVFGPANTGVLKVRAKNIFLQRVRIEEGLRLDVYKDTKGILTVGYGHKVLPSDNLKYGQVISMQRVDELFKKDTDWAFEKGYELAQEAKMLNENMIVAFSEVCYQLGKYWTSSWPNTWKKLKAGDLETVIRTVRGSAWMQQTPKRANNFIAALQRQQREVIV